VVSDPAVPNEQMLQGTTLNALQTINFTLGTSVFVTQGEKIAEAYGGIEWSMPAIARALHLSVLLFWTAKFFAENHNNFKKLQAHPFYSIIQMFGTIIAFMLLIAASAKLTDFSASMGWLTAHFAFLSAWMIGAIPIFWLLGMHDWSKVKWRWVFAALGYFLLAGAIWLRADLAANAALAAILLVLMIALVVADAFVSKTFLGGKDWDR